MKGGRKKKRRMKPTCWKREETERVSDRRHNEICSSAPLPVHLQKKNYHEKKTGWLKKNCLSFSPFCSRLLNPSSLGVDPSHSVIPASGQSIFSMFIGNGFFLYFFFLLSIKFSERFLFQPSVGEARLPRRRLVHLTTAKMSGFWCFRR